MAHRTFDSGKNTRARAGSTAAPEDDMAGVPDDEMTASTEDDSPGDELEGVDEDLRVVPSGTSGSGVVRQSVPAASTGSTIRDRLLANPVTRFPTESAIELATKVTWPQWQYAWNMTLIVIGMSIFVAIILGSADLGLSQFVTWVVSHSGAAPGATPTPTP